MKTFHFSRVFLTLVMGLVLATSLTLAGCDFTPSAYDQNTEVKDRVMQSATATVPAYRPTNFLERQMINWRAKTFDQPNKIGYVYVLVAGVGPIGYYTVFGKVASLNSFNVPQQKVLTGLSGNNPVVDDADVDGTWGHNIEGVFAKTDNGAYIEIPTTGAMGYIYSDIPLPFKVPHLNITVSSTSTK